MDEVHSRRTLLVSGFAAVVSASTVAGATSGRDAKALPPEFRTFPSPAGSYVLELRGPAGWKTPYAQAELFSVSTGGRRSVWSKTLQHRYGPGLAIVSDSGQVLLIDEWLKTPSPQAIVLFSNTGSEAARYSMPEIAAVSGVPSSKLVTAARAGVWMSSPPDAVFSRAVVVLEAGGVRLEINLNSGRLTKIENP